MDHKQQQQHIVAKQPEQEEAEQLLWSIDDDTLFHPLGLINHGTDNKSVFVSWSEEYLVNFVFKTSQRSERTKLTKVRINMPPGEQIAEILILELNTLLLMQSGSVYHFSSVKSMQPVRWLNAGVRCISACKDGFSLIRLQKNLRLHLELYKDVVDLAQSESTLQQSYDISWDEVNLFSCSWTQDRLSILSQAVRAENREFLKQATKNVCDLQTVQELHFFSVAGSVFALIADNAAQDSAMEVCGENAPTAAASATDDYRIQLCAVYAADVLFMRTLCERQMVLLFLQSASIDIWYWSAPSQVIMRLSHHILAAEIVHYEFCASNNCCYYTDEQQVGQLHFVYDPQTASCSVQETSKAVPGILVCTWVQSLQRLVCLSVNNIFYQLKFAAKAPATGNVSVTGGMGSAKANAAELFELTPEKVAQLKAKASKLQQLKRMPYEPYHELCVAAHKLSVFSKLCQAHVRYTTCLAHTTVPAAAKQSSTLFIYTQSNCQLQPASYYALLYLQVQPNEIFRSGLWTLQIKEQAALPPRCQLISLPHNILHRPLCIVLPQLRLRPALLPKFDLTLCCCIAIQQQFLALSIPIAVASELTDWRDLFGVHDSRANLNYAPQLAAMFDKFNAPPQVATAFDGRSPTCTLSLTVTLHLKKSSSFQDVLLLFGKQALQSLQTPALARLYFLNVPLDVRHLQEHNAISLETSDAAVLYYAKYLILCSLKAARTGGCWYGKDAEIRKKCVTKYLHAIEQNYGSIVDAAELPSFDGMHLENLLKTYQNMRTEGGIEDIVVLD